MRINLKISAKKFAVFAAKGHNNLTNVHNLCEIKVVTKYCYLGVTVNNTGSIAPHLKKAKQRSSYLRSHLLYNAYYLSFENQYLL